MLQRSKWIKSETQKAEKLRTYLDETSLKLKGAHNETP